MVRTRLASRRLPAVTADAVWAHLIVRARRGAPDVTATAATHAATHAAAATVPTTPTTTPAGAAAGARRPRTDASGAAGRGRDGRDAVSSPSAWTVGCAGVALPGLVRIAANVAIRHRGHAHDIEAATLSGFLVELHRTDPCIPHIPARLRTAAYRAAVRYRDTLSATPANPAASAAPLIIRDAR
ncbi:hypothetical protein ACQEVB_40815 [Pseudonocardia sp. CA-107938]|uniref:hypothetical protein n=1 Tax=Pseudonocardia sp. CA-107938 TaxID=3240021 RepID=UPI003D93980B